MQQSESQDSTESAGRKKRERPKGSKSTGSVAKTGQDLDAAE